VRATHANPNLSLAILGLFSGLSDQQQVSPGPLDTTPLNLLEGTLLVGPMIGEECSRRRPTCGKLAPHRRSKRPRAAETLGSFTPRYEIF
jgi:hypothetical protein